MLNKISVFLIVTAVILTFLNLTAVNVYSSRDHGDTYCVVWEGLKYIQSARNEGYIFCQCTLTEKHWYGWDAECEESMEFRKPDPNK